MDVVEIDVQKRGKGESVKHLLAASFIPAEYYGKGVENMSLKMDYQTFRRAFIKAGSNTIIGLKVEGKDPINVLVQQVDYNPVTDSFKHVEFINIRMGEVITTHIPLAFVGQAPAVKELAGTLTTHLSELEVKCLPKDLVHSIEVSVDSLVDFHTSIKVADIIVPSTLEILNNPSDVVVNVIAPREEEEEAPVEEAGVEEAGAEGAGAEGADAEGADEKAE